MTVRRLRALLIALAAPALVAHVALAQTRGHSRGHPKPHGATGASTPHTKGGADAGGITAAPAASTPAPPSTVTTTTSSADAGVVETKTIDGGTRVFKFRELDIEGRLKSPQLVYFLRRVRAEFAAGNLGHRSFLREMSETRKERMF